jgi:putative redox protein
MVEMDIAYQGNLRCQAKHGPSGSIILTDAPTDNMGKGEAFSPTDLAGVALATCMLTTMGIVAQRMNVDLSGTTVHVTKEMTASPPRRIETLTVTFTIPARLSAEERQKLENAANNCPVSRALAGNVQMPTTFNWA